MTLASILTATETRAVVGCLTPREELAGRADVVIVGKIERVEIVSLDPCPGSVFEPVKMPSRDVKEDAGVADPRALGPQYQRCGEIHRFSINTEKGVRGSAPPVFWVLVPPRMRTGLFDFACDDRPEPEKMVGLHAVLFLEKTGDQFWSLDGPDSVYCDRAAPSRGEIREWKRLLRKVPREEQ